MICALGLLFYCTAIKGDFGAKAPRTAANSDNTQLAIETAVYHLNDSVSLVFAEIANENLLYKRPDTSAAFYAELKIRFRLYSENNLKKVLDSNTVLVLDRSMQEKIPPRTLETKLTIKAHYNSDFLLELDLYDLNRKSVYSSSLNISKLNKEGAQNFLVTRGDSVLLENRFLKGTQLAIGYSDTSTKQLYVHCYFKELGPAAPPFSTRATAPLSIKPDSAFILEKIGTLFPVTLPEKGFYHLRSDSANVEGLTLFTVDESFPGVNNSLEMINCTRYIMFKEEYERCKNAEDKKSAIDDFWIGIGGSEERALELVKRYYGRVREANKLFSSYTQGWKTDRGMVYIVMGGPSSVVSGKKDEVWVYGNDVNSTVLRFVFIKTQSPFSDNDYVLERSPNFKEPYYYAVDYWRQGVLHYENDR